VFTKPVVLAVEGADEYYLVTALLEWLARHEGVDLTERVDPYDLYGNDDLPEKLSAMANEESFLTVARAVGVLVDAEDRPAADAFASVSGAVAAAFGCPALPEHRLLVRRLGTPSRFGAFILPDGRRSGSLEDLCLSAQAVAADPAMACVDAYLECVLPLVSDTTRAHTMKRRLHAYLTSRPQPGLTIGLAGRAGCWHFEDPVWEPLKQFLQELAAG